LTSPHEHIVDFEQPPVSEVSLAVQFAQPITDATTTLGRFWPMVNTDYSKIEPQPPLPPIEEDFEVPSMPALSFTLMGGPEATRYWLVNSAETEVIQVQPDRFGYNWRQEQTGEPYPRYHHVRSQFETAYSAFIETIQEMGKQANATWCEITYVNPVGFGKPGEARPDLSTVLNRVVPQVLSVLPQPFNTQLGERFQLERDGQPFARFYITAEPTFRLPDRSLGYRLSLLVRGQPPSPDIEGVLSFFDEGRSLIVQTFRDITTSERHKEWGIK
jgi:uncharacterized protein (TIGR04255 family)